MKTTTLTLFSALALTCAAFADKRPNVLFIAVDDLRPELGCYGSSLVKSPHIDRLASMGTLFEAAYCQQAVCHPSRVSLLTGQRPDTTKVTDLYTKFRPIQPDIVTLPQLFRKNGYHTYRMGKIFHMGHGQTEDTKSWTSMPNAKKPQYISAEKGRKPITEAADIPDNRYSDGAHTDDAIKAIARFKKSGEPFFLAVGYLKPHLPFCAPKKYWGLYDRDAIPDSPVTMPPANASTYAMARAEVMGYSIRADRWRYTEWIDLKNREIKDRELYDHKNSALAAHNQAKNPDLAETINKLSALLNKGQGWKAVKQEAEKRLQH